MVRQTIHTSSRENGAFRKRFWNWNWRNSNTPAFCVCVDGKDFENGAFRTRWRHDNHVISLPDFSSNTNPKLSVTVAFSNFPSVAKTENIWCVFRVKNTVLKFLCHTCIVDEVSVSLGQKEHFREFFLALLLMRQWWDPKVINLSRKNDVDFWKTPVTTLILEEYASLQFLFYFLEKFQKTYFANWFPRKFFFQATEERRLLVLLMPVALHHDAFCRGSTCMTKTYIFTSTQNY